jgi:hypothetical protein
MRYLSRNKLYEKVEVNTDAKKIYIFCEGQDTEFKYFKYFSGLSSNIDVIPIPNTNGQSDPVKLKENASLLFFGDEDTCIKYELSKEYKDEVWFVIDTDRWNEGDKINILKKFCLDQYCNENPWEVAQSNPCFELWQYYHFHNDKPESEDVLNSASFKEYVNTKIKGGFDNRSMPIEIKEAIKNSLENFEIEHNQPKLFSTEVHNLAEIIVKFIGNQLEKAKNMTQKV